MPDLAGPERALQLATPAGVPAPVASAVTEILTGGLTLTESFTLAVETLARSGDVDRVAAVSMTLQPDDEAAWIRLGERAWLMEWTSAGAAPTGDSGKDVGAGQAMSLPWFSQQVREWGVVGITDARLLDGPADRDRIELQSTHAAAVLGSSMICDGVMYGSLAVGRAEPGPWPAESMATIRVLCAALASRMAAERDRLALADAIGRGDRARESQQEFFSALGHELRTPISAIMGTAELLAEDAQELADRSGATPADDGETVAAFATAVAKDASVVLSAAEQLLAVIDSLLQTGQELGRPVGKQPVDVAEALGDVVHWLKAPALAAAVTVSFPPDLSECVETTPSGLRQILTNLVGNAIAYNHPGGEVRISTAVSSDEQGSRRVRITVQDTGPGLTLAQQAEVFTPFVRFAGSDVPGTGLGLALSRSLAERDGGLMGVESVPGEGAAFWVDLPGATPAAP